MSELEHYPDDCSAIDREIERAALVCGFDLNSERALRELLAHEVPHLDTPQGRARERLRGLLFLRLKLLNEEKADTANGMHGRT